MAPDSVAGSKILIVEDEYLIAAELADFFMCAGADVLGPVPTIEAASTYGGQAEVAILDVWVGGSLVFPLADELLGNGIPFVFYTGFDDDIIPARFHEATRIFKPAGMQEIQQALLDCLTKSPPEDTVVAALPILRWEARLRLKDEKAADRLVEAVLKQALLEVDQKSVDEPILEWLRHVMSSTWKQRGATLLN